MCQHIIVNICHLSKVWELTKVSSSKVTFKVTEGHLYWCHSIDHIQFPISLILQPCLYLVPFLRYYC